MKNNLSTVTSQTMSSREISQLTGKMHPHVKRDIERMCSEINHPNLEGSEYVHRGNVYTEYLLDRDMTLCLVSGYSAPLRMKIIQRWRELEEAQAPKIPQTLSEALQLAADQAKQLELQAPKVAFVDNLVERKSLMNATQVAQKHGLSAMRLNKILVDLGVYSRTTKRGRVFMQWFITKGYGEMKQTEQGFSQALFTNAGEVWINEKMITEGIV
jgi:phage antirepressor YoqD-like protein